MLSGSSPTADTPPRGRSHYEKCSRRRDVKAVVGDGDPKDHPGTLGLVLARNPLRPPTNGAEHRSRPASGVVPQTLADFLRCFGAGEKGVVGSGDFSRLALGAGHGKSAASFRGAANRNALLCGLNG